MKKLTNPQSGKCGKIVAFKSRYGQVEREHVPTTTPPTDAQLDAQAQFGTASAGWNDLTDPQRDAWDAYAKKVRSHPRGGQSGPLTGQTLLTAVNRNQALLGLPPFKDLRERPLFGANPVVAFSITQRRGRPALKLQLSHAPAGHILVFASRPHNVGRRYCDKFIFLGPLPPLKGSECTITVQYLQKHGPPWPGSRVFLRIIQQIDGWRDLPRGFSAVFAAK